MYFMKLQSANKFGKIGLSFENQKTKERKFFENKKKKKRKMAEKEKSKNLDESENKFFCFFFCF